MHMRPATRETRNDPPVKGGKKRFNFFENCSGSQYNRRRNSHTAPNSGVAVVYTGFPYCPVEFHFKMKTDQTRGNYLFLLAGITSLLIAYPVILEVWGEAGILAIHIAYSMTLLISVWSLVGEKKHFIYGITLTVVSFFITVSEVFLDHPALWFSGIVVQMLFYFLTLTISVRHVMYGGEIDNNRIVGAICIYLLIGLIWAALFSIIHNIYPDSFKGLDPDGLQAQKGELIYFSFVTLTTLGFGDITPLNPIARTLTYLEAIAGQFYLAVMVAGLIGVHVAEHRRGRPENTGQAGATASLRGFSDNMENGHTPTEPSRPVHTLQRPAD